MIKEKNKYNKNQSIKWNQSHQKIKIFNVLKNGLKNKYKNNVLTENENIKIDHFNVLLKAANLIRFQSYNRFQATGNYLSEIKSTFLLVKLKIWYLV